MEATMNEQFLSEIDLAARWAMSSKILTRWRTIRRGPPFVKPLWAPSSAFTGALTVLVVQLHVAEHTVISLMT
jgi:hypothetical protein